MIIPAYLSSTINTELCRHNRCELFTQEIAAWLYTWHPALGDLTAAVLRREIKRAIECVDADPDTTRQLVATL